jgi:hypothetical protein
MTDHCNPAVCQYTYDGVNMPGIRNKLTNAANFGLSGISTCEVEPKRLGLINSSTEIEDLECDIVFIGAFYTNLADITTTTMSSEFLGHIREWSTLCEENLTILTQGESTAWGYTIANQNQNPNTQGASNEPNIFDGPFGVVNSFNQGGTFQANFSQIPNTGALTLAEDNLGRPTVVLDNATNDILLADVGILCSNGAGEVTTSGVIENSNDILACNIFALGCEIAGFSSMTEVDTTICLNTEIELPDGIMVNAAGSYTSNLLSSLDCDSIVVTNVFISDPVIGRESYIGCDQDGYSIMVGDELFDQNNREGLVTLTNAFGCDSLVEVELIYNLHTDGFLDTLLCDDDSFIIDGIVFDSAIDTFITLTNAQNCDSVVNVVVEAFRFDDIEIDEQVSLHNATPFTFNNSFPANFSVQWIPATDLSCSDCINPTLRLGEMIPTYTLEATSDIGCVKEYTINIDYICTPYIPNVFAINSISGNNMFGAETPCRLTDYEMTIYDRWGSIVFETDDQDFRWDGRISQVDEVVPGVYVYQMRYSNLGEAVIETGTITCLQ